MKKSLRFISVLLFSIGTLLGVGFFGATTWADVESTFYGFARYGKRATTALHCPLVVTTQEIGTITFGLHNSSERSIQPTVRFQASSEGVFRDESTSLPLEPGETGHLQWEVSSENVDLERFIFAKVFTFASYPLTDVEQTCGILVLDLPILNGQQVTILTLVVSFACLSGGIALWIRANSPLREKSLDTARAMGTLLVTIIVGLVSILLAWWLLGILTFMVAILLIGVIIANTIQSR
ncbi:MAG: hypothetical protein JXB85_04875 [Anaerolineales bacterium]|nr:hypothetical protein [Anaerolineales bacterium]